MKAHLNDSTPMNTGIIHGSELNKAYFYAIGHVSEISVYEKLLLDAKLV